MFEKFGSVLTMLAFLGMCALGVPKEGLLFVACTLATVLVMFLIVGWLLRRGS